MIYFTSDTHFGHKNVIQYCNRPFSSVEEMDNAMIDNINAKVKATDTLYHLGDFAFSANVGKYRYRLNCQNIHLILGNHDRYNNCKEHFSSIRDMSTVRVGRNIFVLCHYPFAVWNRAHYGTIHLFGHSHGNHNAWREEHMPNSLSMDVGVDPNNFQPLSADEIVEIMAKRAVKQGAALDHHKR